jgi:hypothetical protein
MMMKLLLPQHKDTLTPGASAHSTPHGHHSTTPHTAPRNMHQHQREQQHGHAQPAAQAKADKLRQDR